MSNKKYRNPISKPDKVCVPVWKYEALVASAMKLEIVEAVVGKLDSYDAKKVLDVLFENEEGEK